MDLFSILGILLALAAAIAFYINVLKMGYNPFLSALVFVPVANLIFIIFIAVQKWPIERDMERLKSLYEPATKEPETNDFEDDGEELAEVLVCHYCQTENPPGIAKCIVCGRGLMG